MFKLDNGDKVKKAKGAKKCVVKSHISFSNYVDVHFNNSKLLKSQFTFKSDHHKIYTQKINKIALNYFDDKRIQDNDKITLMVILKMMLILIMKLKIIQINLMKLIIAVLYLKIIILKAL